jgi:hypothetical protein
MSYYEDLRNTIRTATAKVGTPSTSNVYYEELLENVKTIADNIGGGSGGTSDHSQLTNLGYSESGHTGFSTAEQGEKADSALQPNIYQNIYINSTSSSAVDDDTAGTLTKPFKTLSYTMDYCKRMSKHNYRIMLLGGNTAQYSITTSDLTGFIGLIYGNSTTVSNNPKITFSGRINGNQRSFLAISYINLSCASDITIQYLRSLEILGCTFDFSPIFSDISNLKLDSCVLNALENSNYNVTLVNTSLYDNDCVYNGVMISAVNNADGIYFCNNSQTGTSVLGVTNPENAIGYYSLQKKLKDTLANSTTFEQFKQLMV